MTTTVRGGVRERIAEEQGGGAGASFRGHLSARVGRPDGSPRGAGGGDIPVCVSRPDGSPRGAREGDGVAHRGSGSSFVRRSRRRLRTGRLAGDFSEMMSCPEVIHTRV